MNSKITLIIISLLISILIWGSITLSEQFYTSIDFKVMVDNLPKGFTYSSIEPEIITVKLKAKGWQLFALSFGSKPEFTVSADYDSGRKYIDPYNEINENDWFSSGMNLVDVNPRNLSFAVEKVKFKKLKVIADADLSFNQGYGLATPVSIYPDSVMVGGPESIINKKTSIKTLPVSYSYADSKLKLISELENLPGFQLVDTKVELVFDVQRIVEKSFNNIRVTINDLPAGRNIVLIPNIIECSLRGGINILGKLSSDQITASINYDEIVYDTLGSVQPRMTIPDNTSLVYYKPQRLNYFIKKF